MLYAMLVVVAIQLAVIVLLYEDLGGSVASSLNIVDTSQYASQLDSLPGKRAPKTILSSEAELRLSMRSTTSKQHPLLRSEMIITTPTAKAAATSISKQGRPILSSSSAALATRMQGGRSRNRTLLKKPGDGAKKFILETVASSPLSVKPIVSSIPLNSKAATSAEPKHSGPEKLHEGPERLHGEGHEGIVKSREERLKPPSMLRDSLDQKVLMEMEEDRMRRDLMRRAQERRAESLEQEKEEKEEREAKRLKLQQEVREAEKLRLRQEEKLKLQQQQEEEEEAEYRRNVIKAKQTKERKGGRGHQDNEVNWEYMNAERDRAQKLNQLWKERKNSQEHRERPNAERRDAYSLLDTPQDYFKEYCQSTMEPLVECSETPLRNLTAFEAAGNDIMFTMRTTMKYHESRLSVLFDTWLSEIEPSSVFIVTDGEDEDLLWKTNTLGK